jgi:Flp pilus assembly pilin Flp
MRLLRGEDGGQATVEFALILPPILLLLVFGMIELGTALSANLTVASASREGARTAGSFANGGGALGCLAGQSPNWATVDQQIVAAVERVLTAKGAVITLQDATQIRIWRSDAAGNETAAVNVWDYVANGGPMVDGQLLDYRQTSVAWQACSRVNTLPPDSAGVTVKYTYRARTPLRFLIPGLATIQMTDKTVFTLNATK